MDSNKLKALIRVGTNKSFSRSQQAIQQVSVMVQDKLR